MATYVTALTATRLTEQVRGLWGSLHSFWLCSVHKPVVTLRVADVHTPVSKPCLPCFTLCTTSALNSYTALQKNKSQAAGDHTLPPVSAASADKAQAVAFDPSATYQVREACHIGSHPGFSDRASIPMLQFILNLPAHHTSLLDLCFVYNE